MPIENKIDTIEAWKKSRSGAWAGRGFHYQYLFSTLILIRQWAGVAPAGNLVPEGLEDCVIEFPNHEFWLQVKSRKEGTFSAKEVQKIIKEVETKASTLLGKNRRKIYVVLEQSCQGLKAIGIDELFEGLKEQVLVCFSPRDECVAILTSRLNTAEIIAEGIVSDLYELVASASEKNAYLPFEDRRRISTSEIEHRIFERLEAEDPSSIDRALASGMLLPISFSPVAEPAFYHGVKVAPGHVGAGLVFDRVTDRKNLTRILKQRRHVLISGQSGAGKSALLWSSVNNLSGDMRWYQITTQADVARVDSILSFLRARRPTKISPIGLAFDEVGSTNADLWNVLVRELRGMPFVYFLGSVRQEDVTLISNHADTEFVQVSLNEKLAKEVWQKLHADKQTGWEHWREPFEKSDGLMLEFVFILTQGKRLSSVLKEQIQLREQEDRQEELAIIRSSAVLCAHGGEVKVNELISLLKISPDDASLALTRLIDEHLVREDRPGILGGLHMLRSKALIQASHDELIYLSEDSFWQGLLAVTEETLPGVIQSIFTETSNMGEVSLLHKLADILNRDRNIDRWTYILTGLGLATLERNVVSFMEILGEKKVQRAHWALASMFSDPQIKIPDLTEFEQWENIREAVLAFRNFPVQDLRSMCLEKLLDKTLPACQNYCELNKLLSCLSPICGGKCIDLNISTPFIENGAQNIQEIADFLSSAYLISPSLAEKLVEDLGGENVLFDLFKSQTPWVTQPEIDFNGKHGRTIRSNMFFISEQEQTDPHNNICDICKTLIAISPKSEAAASDAVNPLGQTIAFGNYQPWSKNMPRENIPTKTRVSWNVAFRQILLAKSAIDSLTEYTKNMADLVKRTEKLLRSFSEKWIRGKRVPRVEAVTQEINYIINSVNALAYADPAKLSHEMTTPLKDKNDKDSLGALLTGVLGNLILRMNKVTDDGNPKATATFAGNLSDHARKQEQSPIWRTNLTPPLSELNALAERLKSISYLLHEFAYDNSQSAIQNIINSTKTSSVGKAVSSTAKRCLMRADQRFRKKLKSLEKILKNKGWNVKCWSRPIEKADSVYWPPREVAITVDIENFETDASYIEDVLSLGEQHFETDWSFRVVPVINGQVVASLALMPSSQHLPLPDNNFTNDWKNHIDYPFLSSQLMEKFDTALGACIQLSTIITCRDLEQLHPEEEKVFFKAIEAFEQCRDFIFQAKESGSEYITWAYDYLSDSWNQIGNEFEKIKSGQTVNEPLCISPHVALSGIKNDQSHLIASMRLLLLQSECFREKEV